MTKETERFERKCSQCGETYLFCVPMTDEEVEAMPEGFDKDMCESGGGSRFPKNKEEEKNGEWVHYEMGETQPISEIEDVEYMGCDKCKKFIKEKRRIQND